MAGCGNVAGPTIAANFERVPRPEGVIGRVKVMNIARAGAAWQGMCGSGVRLFPAAAHDGGGMWMI